MKNTSIALALQGGGSHGAFTWGVLDRLLDEAGIEFAAVSGTSAGALNAAVLATGLARGGRRGAQAALRDFWGDVGAQRSPYGGSCFGRWPGVGAPRPAAAPALSSYNLDSNPFYAWSSWFLRAFSPYQFDYFGVNPLRAVVARHVDPALLKRSPMALFVVATAVRTGQPRIFDNADTGIDALLASACLPQLFRAVEIDGEPYWDGGYSGNPAIWPLIYRQQSVDVVLVKTSPLVRPQLPDTPDEIVDRANEITFNAGLIAELRAIGFVQKLLSQGAVDPAVYKNLRLHMVADDDGMASLQPSSKVNTAPAFLEALHALGHAAATRWLRTHRADLGQRSTLPLQDEFLAPRHAEQRK